MATPTMPKSPRFLAHPDTFFYRPWAAQVPYNGSLTAEIRSYLTAEGVTISGGFPDPADFDRAVPFADPGPWIESNDTVVGWRVMGDSFAWKSTHWYSHRDEFAPFYIYNGRVRGMAATYNQSSTVYGPGGYGDTHSHVFSRKWGTCQDSYITRAQIGEGYLSNVGALAMWSLTDKRFPTCGRDGDGSWNSYWSGTRTGGSASFMPYSPLVFTHDEALAGINRHVLGMVLGAAQVRQTQFHWPAAHSDGQSADSPYIYGTFIRLAADFDFSRIPPTITGTNLIVLKAWIRTMQTYGAVLMDVGQNELAGFLACAHPSVTLPINDIWDVLEWDDFNFFTISDHMIDPYSMEAS